MIIEGIGLAPAVERTLSAAEVDSAKSLTTPVEAVLTTE